MKIIEIAIVWLITVVLSVVYTGELLEDVHVEKMRRANKQLKTCHAILVGEHIQEEE